MLFHSLDFALFLPIVFSFYWFLLSNNIKKQNILLLCASYVFYGWWDWRFLFLLAFSSLFNYAVGIFVGKNKTILYRRVLLCTSITVNLGLLGFFKYYNFFLDNLVQAFSLFGHNISFKGLHIILPVGISFYTFQTLSYSIDVYRHRINPENDIIAFSAFVSFFPQLLAGPIERASILLPQFLTPRRFNYDRFSDGMRLILLGLFKKIVIADNCALYVNERFLNHSDFTGAVLFTSAFYFAIQIYCDFSGYSDIAIGTARLFGFNLTRNFAYPYFSRDFGEFWRRWHISLSTWLRDYVYIPLGGSRCSIFYRVRNIFIVFVLCGFWHGSNWKFIFWGFLNALYFLPLLIFKTDRNNPEIVARGRLFPPFFEATQIILTFILSIFAWIFFRAENIETAFSIIRRIFSSSLFSTPIANPLEVLLVILILFFIFLEWIQRDKEHALQINHLPKLFRWTIYYTISAIIISYGQFQFQEFIYFQF